ncbi:MAG: NAD-dependent epimerase/dehydratase family protein [Gemmatimonadaceae bacterium]|nr:NAD-dependent epimerase/dehydratase family protein [Gemmatimonadaceae bacterium]MBA3655752.1 NAD-dependent epimerase/dehydratase family protein [Gemmatimonadaceae bacterium]
MKRVLASKISWIAPPSSELDLAHENAAAHLLSELHASDSIVMLSAVTRDKGRDTATLVSNLKMMEAVTSAVSKKGCRHLVYISSDAVYDPAAELISDDTLPSPRDPYGAMHLARELMARSLPGVPLLVLRPTLVYGRGNTHNSYGINRFCRSVREDRKIALFGDGEELRDHIHVDDVADLIFRCLLAGVTGTFNLVTGKSHTFHQIAQLIAEQAQIPVKLESVLRHGAITHRRYVPTRLLDLFTDFSCTPVLTGIRDSLNDNSESP